MRLSWAEDGSVCSPLLTVNGDVIHSSSNGCYPLNHWPGSTASLLVYWCVTRKVG